ncbi:Aste57867_21462 [Aphanomyces stellatus]|uniref:Aste57867_21462 protein n=1 Tax=Aphanomyces stellatus TaxID=120398 RepID=A0A485LMF2_9STRA|nr:hypothetical protein As57867_021393 [Aphanomyces stellatus]VFT98133.1 Aste57867_21462 [Aphanomyces stellatus]
MESAPLVQAEATPAVATRSWSTATKAVAAAALVAVVGTIVYVSLPAKMAVEPTPASFTYAPANFSLAGDLRLRCNETYITQTLDHFTAHHATYQQRYYVCGEFWNATADGPIFFFTGHEQDVDIMVNTTGLMWENAAEFGALLVFAEHRYFGKSFPQIANATFLDSLRFLSSEQALADYAVLVDHVKETFHAEESPVIAFGGSYAGLLAAWFRMKYPQVVDGAIASSAPILAFDWEEPVFDALAYGRTTAFTGSPSAGAAEHCVPNIRRAKGLMMDLGFSPDIGAHAALRESLKLCSMPTVPNDVNTIMDYFMSAYVTLAEGNYPYPSTYFGHFPAYPYRVACDHLAEAEYPDVLALLGNFSLSAGVALNDTGNVPCYEWNATVPVEKRNLWEYLECSELYAPIYKHDGLQDFFRYTPIDQAADAARCKATWGVELRPTWAKDVYGGLAGVRASSNIVFSNGNYDPFSGYGVVMSFDDSIVPIAIEGAAHHLDLMFSNDADPETVRAARATEMSHVRKWIDEAKKAAEQE